MTIVTDSTRRAGGEGASIILLSFSFFFFFCLFVSLLAVMLGREETLIEYFFSRRRKCTRPHNPGWQVHNPMLITFLRFKLRERETLLFACANRTKPCDFLSLSLSLLMILAWCCLLLSCRPVKQAAAVQFGARITTHRGYPHIHPGTTHTKTTPSV